MRKMMVIMGLVGTMLVGCSKQDMTYTAKMVAVETTSTGCLLEDINGECFYWEYGNNEKPLEEGQTVTVTMDGMGTETVYDDEIVSFQ